MSVVIEVVGPAVGGIRQHVTELVGRVRDAGVEVTVVGPDVDSGLAVDVTIPSATPLRPWQFWRAARALRAVPGALVHAHGMTVGWVAVAAGSKTPRARPLILTVHNVVLGRSLLRRLEGPLYRRCDLVIAPSAEIADRVRRLAPHVRVVEVVPTFPMPIPTRPRHEVRARLGVEPHAVMVLIPARLHPQKDHPTMLRSLAAIADGRTGWSVVLVGDGPERDRIRSLVDALDLGSVVTMVGRRSDVADLMAAADVVLCGSIWEAVPLVVLEAMLVGVAVLSTEVGIVGELADERGLVLSVVPVGDVAAMGGALAELLDDPDSRRALAERSHALAIDRFDPSRLAAQVLAIYAELTP